MLHDKDDYDSYFEDTMKAGHYENRKESVDLMIRSSRAVSYTHLDVYKRQAKWMAIYNDFVVGYESGMTMVEIAKRNNVSVRTIYRYKAYYDKMKKKEE